MNQATQQGTGRHPAKRVRHIGVTTVICLAGLTACSVRAEEPAEWSLARTHGLPTELEGLPGKIHTQGLLVTDRFFYVTGRHETAPKRAILMRFERASPAKHEWIDITPPLDRDRNGTAVRLDHPGGFDVDAQGALIVPVSTSHRRGPSMIYRIQPQPDAPLKMAEVEPIATLTDHLGALSIDRLDQSVYAANWDTQHLYFWKRLTPSAKPQKIASRSLFPDQKPWPLAIQDFKGIPGGQIIAGGIDKSPQRDKEQSKAVVQWLDFRNGSVQRSVRLPDRPNVRRPLTNEGLCWADNRLYLLPEDIGQGAKVLEFHRSTTSHDQDLPAER